MFRIKYSLDQFTLAEAFSISERFVQSTRRPYHVMLAQDRLATLHGMGRPPLNVQRTHLNLDPDDIARVTAIVGRKGLSKFVRDAIRQQHDRIAPGEEQAGPPFFESDGGHEPRLSVSGRATVFSILRKKGKSLDEMQRAFGFADPIDFLHALMGHKPLPDQAASAIVIFTILSVRASMIHVV